MGNGTVLSEHTSADPVAFFRSSSVNLLQPSNSSLKSWPLVISR